MVEQSRPSISQVHLVGKDLVVAGLLTFEPHSTFQRELLLLEVVVVAVGLQVVDTVGH
jgi:hypothetical protein